MSNKAQQQATCEVESCKWTGATREGLCPTHFTEWEANQKQSRDSEEVKPLRPLAAIIADLSKPIAARHLKQKTKGGKAMDFIPWYHAVKYLDLYAPGWSYEIRSITPLGNQVAVVARITVPCTEGFVHREATGIEDEEVKGYGDATSNAESMALRRAASKFGLGLYLYNK